MKKAKGKKKEVPKIKLRKTTGVTFSRKRIHHEPDPWKEIGLKFKLLTKAYVKYREKRKIAKEKEEQKKLKEGEEERM